MQKTINILIVVALVLGAWYLTVHTKKVNVDKEPESLVGTYSQPELGLEFDYPIGPKGYVIEDRMSVEPGSGLAKVIVLFRTEDTLNMNPEAGEGPAVITVVVFENPKKQTAKVWAAENPMFSNINGKVGEIAEDVIGGENAIRYMADGLYASEFAVVTHGTYAYVINGQFIDENSDIRRDFAPLLESIRLVPESATLNNNPPINTKPIPSPKPAPDMIYCTQEAKQCPDGSYVGRTGPNCEFSPCPAQ